MLNVANQTMESRCLTLTDKLEVLGQEFQKLQRDHELLTLENMSMRQLKKDQETLISNQNDQIALLKQKVERG